MPSLDLQAAVDQVLIGSGVEVSSCLSAGNDDVASNTEEKEEVTPMCAGQLLWAS